MAVDPRPQQSHVGPPMVSKCRDPEIGFPGNVSIDCNGSAHSVLCGQKGMCTLGQGLESVL